MKDYLFIIFVVALIANTLLAFVFKIRIRHGVVLTFIQAILIAFFYALFIICTA